MDARPGLVESSAWIADDGLDRSVARGREPVAETDDQRPPINATHGSRSKGHAMTMDRHGHMDPGTGASHGRLGPASDAAVTDDELLGLSESPDGVITLLNFLCAKLRDDGQADTDRRLPLGSVGSTGRQLLARHFAPQRFAQIAGDPDQSRWHRLMALRVLEIGVTEWRYLEMDGHALTLSEPAYLMVASLKRRDDLDAAAATLELFTGRDRQLCRAMVEAVVDAADVDGSRRADGRHSCESDAA